MLRRSLGVALALAAALSAGCGGDEARVVTGGVADPAEAPAAATRVAELIRDRDYEAIYEAASPEFRGANGREDVVERLGALEGFGRLLEWEERGEVRLDADGEETLAVVPLALRFELGEGPLDVTLRSDDGEWRLDFYRFDVTATTFDPPYPATESGADKLAHRFMFLWQNRRYGDLAAVMPLDETEEEVREFLSRLEPAGDFLTMTRAGFSSTRKSGTLTAKADYNLRFERGRGFIVFTLEQRGDEWVIEAVKYDVEYRTDPADES